MRISVHKALIENGYREMESTGERVGYRIYYENVNSLVNAVLFVDASKYNESFMTAFKNSMTGQLMAAGLNVHYMTVICVDASIDKYLEEMTIAKQVCADNSFAWIYDDTNRKLIITENQTEDFYGLKKVLESAVGYSEDKIKQEESKSSKDKTSAVKDIPVITSSLVAINVLVFVICTFTGKLLYNIGGAGLLFMYSPIQLYRVITSMFLHADINHIFSNMVLLFFLGQVIEKEIGKLNFSIMYFFSGIWGCFAMFISELITEENVMVVGASGAIFGLLGGLFSLVLFKRITSRTMPLGRVLLVIVLCVYNGFTQADTANWAHVGGLLAGFLVGVVYCLTVCKRPKGERISEN